MRIGKKEKIKTIGAISIVTIIILTIAWIAIVLVIQSGEKAELREILKADTPEMHGHLETAVNGSYKALKHMEKYYGNKDTFTVKYFSEVGTGETCHETIIYSEKYEQTFSVFEDLQKNASSPKIVDHYYKLYLYDEAQAYFQKFIEEEVDTDVVVKIEFGETVVSPKTLSSNATLEEYLKCDSKIIRIDIISKDLHYNLSKKSHDEILNNFIQNKISRVSLSFWVGNINFESAKALNMNDFYTYCIEDIDEIKSYLIDGTLSISSYDLQEY